VDGLICKERARPSFPVELPEETSQPDYPFCAAAPHTDETIFNSYANQRRFA